MRSCRMENVADLCIGCGMCCDGTIFDATELHHDDELAPLQQLQAVFTTDQHSTRLQQPCPAFGEGCCSIYDQRPGSCREYSCALLTAVAEGATSQDEATDVIAAATALRDQVRPAIARLNLDLGPPRSPGLAELAGIGPGARSRQALVAPSFSSELASTLSRISARPDADLLTKRHTAVLKQAAELRALLVARFGLGEWDQVGG